jgi:predicted O-methyltransferase YrrM
MKIGELHLLTLSDPPIHDARLVRAGDDTCQTWRYFAKLVRRLAPRRVVELGTGTGRTASQIMVSLPPGSSFTTINWPNPPSGDNVGIELKPWEADSRLTLILGDTRDAAVVAQVVDEGDDIDLLYIDSGTTHEYALIAAEWELYRPKLADGAIVVVDDIHFAGSDMERFWEPLRYEKVEIELGGVAAGMFRYVKEA